MHPAEQPLYQLSWFAAKGKLISACCFVCDVQVIKTKLPWEKLGAIPEMLQTSWGSLFRYLFLLAVGTFGAQFARLLLVTGVAPGVDASQCSSSRPPSVTADFIVMSDGRCNFSIKSPLNTMLTVP